MRSGWRLLTTVVVLLAMVLAQGAESYAQPGRQGAQDRLAALESLRAEEEYNFQMGLGLSQTLREGYAALAAEYPTMRELAAWARYRVAEVDYSRDRFDEAIGQLLAVATEAASSAVAIEAKLLVAEILDSPYNPGQNPEAAAALVDEIAAAHPGSERAQVARLARHGAKQVAKREFNAMVESHASKLVGKPFWPPSSQDDAIARAIKGKHNEDLTRAHRQLASGKANQGDYAGAYATISELISAYKGRGENPYNYFTYATTVQDLEFQKALALASQGKKPEAIAELQTFAQRYPESHLSVRARTRIAELSPQPAPDSTPAAATPGAGATTEPSLGNACVCGPAALRVALAQVGAIADLDRLVAAAGTTGDGTTIAGLLAAAQAQGVHAYGLQVAKGDLGRVRLPAVALWHDHYVTVTAVAGNEVTYYDPLVGWASRSRHEFDTLWEGYLVVFAGTEAEALQGVTGARLLTPEEQMNLSGRYLCGNAGGRDTPGCDGSPCNNHVPSDPASDGDQDGAEDDVNPVQGNHNHETPDLVPPADNSPFDFSGSFNSQASTSDSDMGPGWSPPYSDRVITLSDSNPQWQMRDGSRLTFTRNIDGSFTSPPGSFDRLTQLADGAFKLQRRNLETYTFDSAGRLQSQFNRNDRGIAITRDAQSRISQVTDSSGRSVVFAYGTNGKLSSLTDSLGRATLFGYNADKRLTQITYGDGRIHSYEYDTQGMLTRFVDGRGNATTYEFGYVALHTGYGQISGKVNAVGLRRTFGDNSLSNTRVTDYLGNATIYAWDSQKRVNAITDPFGNKVRYEYSPDNQVTAVVDALGNRYQYLYDARGNLTTRIDPLGNKTRYDYNDLGQVTRVLTPAGQSTAYSYDARGNLLTITNPSGKQMSYTYDTQGNVTNITDFAGVVTQYQYDSRGWLVMQTDPQGNTTRYDYDAWGRRTATTDPLGRVTGFAYNLAGQVTRISYPDLTSESMAYEGQRLISRTNRLGNAVQYDYDALGHLTQVTQPDGVIVRYSYDANGRQTTVTDPLGNSTSRTFDAKGRLTKVTYPGGLVESYTYDARDLLISKTNPAGMTTSYIYDAAGRLIRTEER